MKLTAAVVAYCIFELIAGPPLWLYVVAPLLRADVAAIARLVHPQ